MQGDGLGKFLAPGGRVTQHQLSQVREKVLATEVVDASEDSVSALTASEAQGERSACDSRESENGNLFIHSTFIDGVIKWVHNREKPNQQKSRYSSALVGFLVYWGRRILIHYSPTQVRGPGAVRQVWMSQECHKGLLGVSEVRALAAHNARDHCSHAQPGDWCLSTSERCAGSRRADTCTKRSGKRPGHPPSGRQF